VSATGDNVLKIKQILKKHREGVACETRHMKKGGRISTLIELPPRGIAWLNYCRTTKVVAITNTIVEL
jgi:hypothetical protein